jgi:putative MATE family efflux protein
MRSEKLGTDSIASLLFKQALPASMGFMAMSIYMVVDTIFVGKYVGFMGIAAVAVVMPITFLISSIGMGIGIGGASIVSRSLGDNNQPKAFRSFGNQISLTLLMSAIIFVIGLLFSKQILTLFGAKGEILPHAKEYFRIILPGIPFLAWAMMSNNNLRAEGRAKMAMLVLLVSSVMNVGLDYLFIVVYKQGLTGAAWATTISYFSAAMVSIVYFGSGKSELKLTRNDFRFDKKILREISSIGGVTILRQGSISLLAIVLNYNLFKYGSIDGIGGEQAISSYGIVNRMAMFVFFPIIGITQGFMPIAGYNYGAKNYQRVKETIKTSILWGGLIAGCICILLLSFSKSVVHLFTTDEVLLNETPKAIFWIFLASPLIIVQILSSTYYQAIGKALPALMLTLTKQFFFLVPLVLLLPTLLGLNGLWVAFTLSDVLSGSVCGFYLWKAAKQLNPTIEAE